ncbi:MAG: type II secretion system minor pseudopilin GspK [Gammaproteobacteria bacterium]|nr:type II secretion system minor pseudopilin GspK [Gammaproteobacteria bacterium]
MSARSQRGVALLTAVILVALATVMAAAIAFDSVMSTRRGSAVFAAEQGLLYAEAAEALAAQILREDLKSGSREDHPAERWAQPFGPLEIAPGVMLEARLEDLEGRFNLNSLVQADGSSDPAAIARFGRLLEALGLETRWAGLMADWIDNTPQANLPDGAEDSLYMSQDPPYRAPNMAITSVSELLALPGFGRDRYLKLAPYVSALPRDVPLNVCSAPGVVLDALHPTDHEYGVDPERLARERREHCFPTLDTLKQSLQQALPAEEYTALAARLSTQSNYFRLTSIVTIGATELALYSLLQRDQTAGGQVRPILRTYGLE